MGTPFFTNKMMNVSLSRATPSPKTAVGIMVAGLKLRFDRQMKGMTVMCCDNLKKNGEMCEDLVLTLAGKYSEKLVAWIKENVTFPNSMVDRITPASDPKNESYLLEKYRVDFKFLVFLNFQQKQS